MNKAFTVFKGHEITKTFYVNETINGVTGPYDMTLRTLVVKAYDRSEPTPILLYTISPSNRGLGFVTFVFDASQTNQPGPFDYLLLEDPSGINKILSYGAITPVDVHNYIPFNDILVAETPEGLTIPDSFSSVRSYQWRLFLQNALDPHIADIDVNNEAAWPPLMNFLIAKLTVYSYIINLVESGMFGSLSAGFTGVTAGVKKIETGPSNAEFYDIQKSLASMFKPNASGKTLFDTLKQETCELAKKLRINLPEICGRLDESPVIPIKVGRPEVVTSIEYLQAQFGES